jgi:predicted acyl esterase
MRLTIVLLLFAASSAAAQDSSYIVEHNVQVRMRDGATVCALIVRPPAPPRLAALLMFTIYADSAPNFAEARRAAANGYAGVVGFTRGKACSPNTPVPYRYDGADAAALIDWIATQSWSDGRVGMYGGSYSGFTTWAAAGHRPKALKAIMVGAAAGPGVDVPMEGNIVWNFIYQWPFYTTNNKTLDNATYFDNARWQRLNRAWYTSGRAYRDLDKIEGTPNPVFNEWISHSSYDAYWRDVIPSAAEFAKIDIPVLQTAGYFWGGPGAAQYYFDQHYAHNPKARHYLLIGPYNHPQAQRGVVNARGDTATKLGGYEIDSVARIDIVAELRYRWFDWVLKGGPRPRLLEDRVNYQVMGANVWKHAPSIKAMSDSSLRVPLGPERTLRFDLAYRGDVDSTFPGGGIRDTAVNTYGALEYVSEPLRDPTEVSGLFRGHLEFMTNKRDVDLTIQMFERTTAGEYFQLPPYQQRMSYRRDPTQRRLLTPGARETLDFTSRVLFSRRMARGSRIVMVIGPIKWPGQQINYGSGREVNDETLADAGEPLEIRFLAGSYVELPVRTH